MTKDEAPADDLKLCPVSWCDNPSPKKRRAGNLHYVRCNECGTTTPKFYNSDDAATAWNGSPPTRPEALQAQPVREALKKARAQFEFYVQAHLNKAPPDMDKAATNQEFVEMIDAALTASPPVVEREAINRALILAVEDAIDQPPRSYDIEPMEVRDYRHSLYRIWSPLRDAILALTSVAQGDEVREALEQLADCVFASGLTKENTNQWLAARKALATLTKGARDAG